MLTFKAHIPTVCVVLPVSQCVFVNSSHKITGNDPHGEVIVISIKGPSVNLNKPIWIAAAHLDIEHDIVNQRPHDKAHMEVGSSHRLPIHLTAMGFQVLTVILCHLEA